MRQEKIKSHAGLSATRGEMEEIMEKTNTGKYAIWLTGSRMTIQRTVWKIGEKHFVKWGGNLIEVMRGTHSYYSVEEY